MQKVLLITPPFTQLNTPYPATAYIKGFLNTKGITSFQMDLGIEVILSLFSKVGLQQLFSVACSKSKSANAERIFQLRKDYIHCVDSVISFLQGHNPTLARLICQGNYLPEASRFSNLADLEFSFGNMGVQDKAKYFATLYLEDISDYIVECIDPNFGFSRYAEKLGRSANDFDEIYDELSKELSYIDAISLEIIEEKIQNINPSLVCLSVPFPGNLFSAFRIGKFIKQKYPEIKICMGGGFPNTELRELTDIRVFEFFDFISLDDGERPLEQIIASLVSETSLKRTFVLENGVVTYKNDAKLSDYKQSECGTPDYTDLLLDKYISVIEIANPMHSLWTDGRWNKLTMAHGCYWGKCTFCDISLDYIKIYEPITAKLLADRVEEIIAQTQERGFHFVDEAAPPALMREFALEIIRRGVNITWWTNIRFEKSFSSDLCKLFKASGCIAVSGGLEVASDRLLNLIKKGVTVEQVAKVCNNFTQSGIMVHAYLMYGFPSQTVQETIDSLEMVRQLFESGVMQSGYWHQFALTAHSPVGKNPKDYGIIPVTNAISFANNDINFTDTTAIDHDKFSFGLKKSLLNYMHGIGFEYPLKDWFDFKIPKTTVDSDFIYKSLNNSEIGKINQNAKVIWLHELPIIRESEDSKEIVLEFHDKKNASEISLPVLEGKWLLNILEIIQVNNTKNSEYKTLKQDFEDCKLGDFDIFWHSEELEALKEMGLVTV